MELLTILILILSCPLIVTSEDYHYMAYVIQWVPTYCGRVNCKADIMQRPLRFTLHGLWPGNSTGGSLKCNPPPHGTEDKVKEVWKNSKTLEDNLHKYWPSLSSDGWTDEEFWMHEWEAHGYCTKQTLPAADYFRAAIVANVDKLLARVRNTFMTANMVGLGDQAYDKQHLIIALHNARGLPPDPYISCIPKNSSHVFLKEIHFCLDKTKLQRFIPCPTSQDTRGCGEGNIIIPSRAIYGSLLQAGG
ncbi:ribonuclease 3-like [Lycium ferocissimum]|uniref:ribonuclease 3-like n=1 Tax=Lycium ferocissimum TaxID=112874 RepID=UPI00281617A3|nr:ribonuclease 3-like [Lycium ferocissimum]